MGGDKASDAVVFNSLYRTDGEVQVLKVNPDGEPLSGASFSIYPADDSGEMAAEPLVDKLEYIVDAENPGVADESRFTTRLGPGTYFLVETKAGEQSQLLPRQWQFSVKPGPEDGEIRTPEALCLSPAPSIRAWWRSFRRNRQRVRN